MKLHFLLLVYLNIFQIQCTENTTETEENVDIAVGEVQVTAPFYPHRVGIKNPRYNCYMNAVFSCLYDIPFFQDTVYRLAEELPELSAPGQSTLISLADIFVKMRMASQPVSLERTMFPAIKESMGWQVGEYQCVLEFWGSFVETMPERFKELFQVKVATNYIRKSDDRVLKSIPDVYNYINIPVPSEPITISSIISNQFLDEQVEEYKILPSEQHEYGDLFSEPLTEAIRIPVKSTVTFTNKPDVLVFGVKRLNYNFETGENVLNEVPVFFDSFDLDGEVYLPIANVIFSKEHYFALVKDVSYGDLFLHNDVLVEYMDTFYPQDAFIWGEMMRRKSVLVFYVKRNSLLGLMGEKFVAVRENKDIPQCLLNLQSKPKIRIMPPVSEGDERKAVRKRKLNANMTSYYKGKQRKSIKAKKIVPTEPVLQEEKVEEEVFELESPSSSSSTVSEPEVEVENEPATVFEDNVETANGTEEVGSATEDMDSVALDASDLDPELVQELIDNSPLYTEEQLKKQLEEREKGKAQPAIEVIEVEEQDDTEAQTNDQSIEQVQPAADSVIIKNIESVPPVEPPLALQPSQQAQVVQQTVYQQTQVDEQQAVYKQTQVDERQQLLQQSAGHYQPQESLREQPCVQELKQNFDLEEMKKELNYYRSKLIDPSYILGRESYTFSYSASLPRSYALELVLTAFASNSAIVKKFFSLSNENYMNKWENIIATILIQMLIGAKDISLHYLNFHLRKFGELRIMDQEEGDLCSKLYKLLFFLSTKLSFDLMPLANLKKIVYSELDSDEPTEIAGGVINRIPILNAVDCIYPRRASISGLFFDKITNQNRLRQVFSTNGLIFPVFLYRFGPDKKISRDDVFFNIVDYAIIGGVLFNDTEIYGEFFSTHTLSSSLRFNYGTGGAFNHIEKMEDYTKYFDDLMERTRKNSCVLFVTRSSCWNIDSIWAGEIPNFFAKNALKKIQENLFLRMQAAGKVIQQTTDESTNGQQTTQGTAHSTSQSIPVQQCSLQSKFMRENTGTQTAAPINHSFTQQQSTNTVYRSPLTAKLFPNSRSPQQTTVVDVEGREFSVPQAPKNRNSQKFKHFIKK